MFLVWLDINQLIVCWVLVLGKNNQKILTIFQKVAPAALLDH